MSRRGLLARVVLFPVTGAGESEFGMDRMVHYAGAPGQTTRTLCGWEGGGRSADTTDAITCHDCRAIVAHVRVTP